MKTRNKILLIIATALLFMVYIYFNFSSAGRLSIDEKSKILGLENQNVSGFYENEKLENGFEFSWTQQEAVKRARVEGSRMVIAVFCMKPDIEKVPVDFQILVDDKVIDEVSLDGQEIKYLEYNISDMGYAVGERIGIMFIISELWSPADYGGSTDTRQLGIGIGKINFTE